MEAGKINAYDILYTIHKVRYVLTWIIMPYLEFYACNNFFVLALKMIAEDNVSVNLAASKCSVPRKTLDFRLKLMKNRGRGEHI